MTDPDITEHGLGHLSEEDWEKVLEGVDVHARVRKLTNALRAIVAQGGTLSDSVLMSKTGPNDARARGILYVNCRDIAKEALEP